MTQSIGSSDATMLLARFVAALLSVGLTAWGASVASGQNYPNKPIRMVTGEVGGGPDYVARLIARGISGPLGQQVIVDNRPTGIIPADIVSKAPPDGYTLLVTSNVLWITPLLQNTPYDPLKDFLPITLATISPNILVVHPSVAAQSVKELIALAKAKPGTLNYASSSTGTASHLAGELFKSMAGVDIVRVPYKGASLATNDLISGQVQLAFFTATSVMPHVKTGRLRALAVTSAQRFARFPELPTVASALPGYESGAIYGVFAPAKTSRTIVNRLNQQIVQVLNTAEVKEKVFNAASEVVASLPEQLGTTMKSEIVRMGKVIKDAGIRID